VPDYRVYCLDIDGSIMSGEFITAEDDTAAVEAVRKREAPTDCELWLGRNKFALIPAGGGEPIFFPEVVLGQRAT